MSLGPNDLARRIGTTIEYRTEPLRLPIDLRDLITADQHQLHIHFECSVQPADHPSDRKMLHEMFLARDDSASIDEAVVYFQERLYESLNTSASKSTAAELLDDAGRSRLLIVLRKSADAAGFSAGLLVLAPFNVTVSSPTVIRQQIEAMERSRAQANANNRLEHLKQAGELLKEFEAIRSASPTLSAGRLLESVAPADRGAMLESLLSASATSSEHKVLYAVAGDSLVSVDTTARPLKPRIIALPATLGPLRSVQPASIDGKKYLLLGARGGFFQAELEDLTNVTAYPDPQLTSPQGINRVAFWNSRTGFWATHSEVGVFAWGMGNTVGPHTRVTCPGARNFTVIDATWAVYSVDNQLYLQDTEDTATLPAESLASVVSIVPETDRLFIAHADGLICTMDRTTREITSRENRGGKICAAGALPWLDGIRLLLACEAGGIDCVGTDDSLVTRYNSNYQGVRAIAAGSGTVAAVSPDRQRIIVWDSHITRAPAADLHLLSLTRHRIADIAFA